VDSTRRYYYHRHHHRQFLHPLAVVVAAVMVGYRSMVLVPRSERLLMTTPRLE
jgi:hypothetical protein